MKNQQRPFRKQEQEAPASSPTRAALVRENNEFARTIVALRLKRIQTNDLLTDANTFLDVVGNDARVPLALRADAKLLAKRIQAYFTGDQP